MKDNNFFQRLERKLDAWNENLDELSKNLNPEKMWKILYGDVEPSDLDEKYLQKYHIRKLYLIFRFILFMAGLLIAGYMSMVIVGSINDLLITVGYEPFQNMPETASDNKGSDSGNKLSFTKIIFKFALVLVFQLAVLSFGHILILMALLPKKSQEKLEILTKKLERVHYLIDNGEMEKILYGLIKGKPEDFRIIRLASYFVRLICFAFGLFLISYSIDFFIDPDSHITDSDRKKIEEIEYAVETGKMNEDLGNTKVQEIKPSPLIVLIRYGVVGFVFFISGIFGIKFGYNYFSKLHNKIDNYLESPKAQLHGEIVGSIIFIIILIIAIAFGGYFD